MLPSEEQHKWDMIGELYDPDCSTCKECQFNHTWYEHHPYGSTTATEEHVECKLLGSSTGSPEDCQLFVTAVERQHDDR